MRGLEALEESGLPTRKIPPAPGVYPTGKKSFSCAFPDRDMNTEVEARGGGPRGRNDCMDFLEFPFPVSGDRKVLVVPQGTGLEFL